MNKGKRWQVEENILMINQILENKTISNISNDLGRSDYAITKQLEKLLMNENINILNMYNDLLIKTIKENKNSLYKQLMYNEISININPEIKLLMNDIINEIEDLSELNEEQFACYDLATKGKNILITGSGGVGKSTVLKKIINYYKRNKKNIAVTASTGVAASLINGTTLHSCLKIGIANKPVNDLYDSLISKVNKSDYNRLKKLDVLIIDEISMIDDKLFTKIAGYLSLIKNIKKPFGKIQIILCGDFYQLPPIKNDYCFKSKIWDKLKIKVVELKKQMRQLDDIKLQNILENIKKNNITDSIYEELEKLQNNKLNNTIRPTIMYSKNVDIDKINTTEFNNLVKKYNYYVYTFPIKYDTNNKKIDNFIKKLDEKEIKLCKGLQIMITYNIDLDNKITNGTRAIIENIDYPNIMIRTIDNILYNISYVKYINEFDNEIQYEYIPIKLAYALTIHHSQGQTLDYIEIDLGDTIFEYGMAYVALSRAKKLNSIYISNLSRNAFKINKDVVKFYENIN